MHKSCKKRVNYSVDFTSACVLICKFAKSWFLATSLKGDSATRVSKRHLPNVLEVYQQLILGQCTRQDNLSSMAPCCVKAHIVNFNRSRFHSPNINVHESGASINQELGGILENYLGAHWLHCLFDTVTVLTWAEALLCPRRRLHWTFYIIHFTFAPLYMHHLHHYTSYSLHLDHQTNVI